MEKVAVETLEFPRYEDSFLDRILENGLMRFTEIFFELDPRLAMILLPAIALTKI